VAVKAETMSMRQNLVRRHFVGEKVEVGWYSFDPMTYGLTGGYPSMIFGGPTMSM
jgi:hypothetical protein